MTLLDFDTQGIVFPSSVSLGEVGFLLIVMQFSGSYKGGQNWLNHPMSLKLFITIFSELCRRQMDSVCELLFVWISQSSFKPLQEHDKYQNLEGHSLRISSENRNLHLHSYQRKLNCHFPFSFPWRGSLKAECWIKEVYDIRETFAELCGGFRSWL